MNVLTAPEKSSAELSFAIDNSEKVLPITAHPKPNLLQLEGVFLTKGQHQLHLVAVTPGRAVFDCLQLEPATRVPDAWEAEEQKVVEVSDGAETPVASQPRRDASGGRVLAFHARKAGQGFAVQFDQRPALPYVLGVRPLYTPAAGKVQAFVNDAPIGPAFDLYATEPHIGSSVLPLGPVPSDARAVEIRVVGKNEASHGLDAGFDYFRWEPSILGPGTAKGIWAHVIGKRGCDYRPQDLGSAYSGGHQFWVQPSSSNAWIDIAIEVPTGSDYEIQAKYTKSWDYANIQALLDGQPLGPVVDTYSPTVVPADPITLGKVSLSAGQHVLRFKAVGHNPESKGYLMGIDHVIVK